MKMRLAIAGMALSLIGNSYLFGSSIATISLSAPLFNHYGGGNTEQIAASPDLSQIKYFFRQQKVLGIDKKKKLLGEGADYNGIYYWDGNSRINCLAGFGGISKYYSLNLACNSVSDAQKWNLGNIILSYATTDLSCDGYVSTVSSSGNLISPYWMNGDRISEDTKSVITPDGSFFVNLYRDYYGNDFYYNYGSIDASGTINNVSITNKLPSYTGSSNYFRFKILNPESSSGTIVTYPLVCVFVDDNNQYCSVVGSVTKTTDLWTKLPKYSVSWPDTCQQWGITADEGGCFDISCSDYISSINGYRIILVYKDPVNLTLNDKLGTINSGTIAFETQSDYQILPRNIEDILTVNIHLSTDGSKIFGAYGIFNSVIITPTINVLATTYDNLKSQNPLPVSFSKTILLSIHSDTAINTVPTPDGSDAFTKFVIFTCGDDLATLSGTISWQ